MSRAFVFPGQGAQTIGMGRALAETYPAAQAVFDEVDEALGEKLSGLIWEGEAEELTLTQNAQPALMATSIAALRAAVISAPSTATGSATRATPTARASDPCRPAPPSSPAGCRSRSDARSP